MSVTPRVLVVAGRDPSGAGLDADRDALASLAVEALYVATAETDQDDRGVHSVGARDPRAWGAEAEAWALAGVAVVKFGLLPGAAHVARASRLVTALRAHPTALRAHPTALRAHPTALRARGIPQIVLDPVIAASSGARFLDGAGVEALRAELCGLGALITPNVLEAAELARVPARELQHDLAARLDAARILLGLGAAAVVLKGGHGAEDPVRDLVLGAGQEAVWLEHPRIAGGALRGTGCRFASHLAGRLALGDALVAAARAAGEFTAGRIAAAAR